MTELITITVKSKTGVINDLQVAEVLAIDGKPYTPAGSLEALTALVNHLTGRIASVEQIVGSLFDKGE